MSMKKYNSSKPLDSMLRLPLFFSIKKIYKKKEKKKEHISQAFICMHYSFGRPNSKRVSKIRYLSLLIEKLKLLKLVSTTLQLHFSLSIKKSCVTLIIGVRFAAD